MGSWLSILVNLWISYNTIFLSNGKLAQWRVADPVSFYTRRTTIVFGISGYVKLGTLYCHAMFWETGSFSRGSHEKSLAPRVGLGRGA